MAEKEKKQKVRVNVTLEVDVQDWVTAYSTDPSCVRDEVESDLHYHKTGGLIAMGAPDAAYTIVSFGQPEQVEV